MIEKQLEKFPEGWLVEQRGEYYWHTYKDGIRKRTYLSKQKDEAIIKILGIKTKKNKTLNQELKTVNKIIEKNKPLAEKAISCLILPKIKYPPTDSMSPVKRQYLTYKTNRGEYVRSKSEKIISDVLYAMNIDYRYEATLTLDEIDYHPDFTIISPLNGQTYYWEHVGLTNNEEYIKSWIKRKKVYKRHGIVPETNLIITTEKQISSIEEFAMQKFSVNRYKGLFTLTLSYQF